MKNVKLAGETDFANQEAAEEFFFFTYLLNVLWEKVYVEERVFRLLRLACLTSMLANKPTYANDNLVDKMCHQRLAGTYLCIPPSEQRLRIC